MTNEPEQTRRGNGSNKGKVDGTAFFARIRDLLQKDSFDEARRVVSDTLPKIPLDSLSDIGRELVGVWDAQLDIGRGIIWVTGDIGVTLMGTVAYPYDIYGRRMRPTAVVDYPSDAWWGYAGRPLKHRHMCPIGLPLRHSPKERYYFGHLKEAPGGGTLIFEDDKGQTQRIDYNGNIIPENQNVSERTAMHKPYESRAIMIGDIVSGRYEFTGVLGQGGFATVFRAYDKMQNNDVAIRVPRSETLTKERWQYEYNQNMEIWRLLPLHPNIIKCDISMIDGVPSQILEITDGGDLKLWIVNGKLTSVPQILDVAIQMSKALSAVHKAGIVHLNLKPNNVLMTNQGDCKLAGFGLAVRLDVDQRTVQALGYTPAYCSPEQSFKQPINCKSDMWNWGLIVLEMFARDINWTTGASGAEALKNFLKTGPENKSEAKMPRALANLLSGCFRREPEQRPANMDSIIAKLLEIYYEVTQTCFKLNDSSKTSHADRITIPPRKMSDREVWTLLRKVTSDTERLATEGTPKVEGYDIERKLGRSGRSGMGVVYLARRKMDNKPVVFKVMLTKGRVNERNQRLFLRELEVLRTLLQHPHILQLVDHGRTDTTIYFAMEYCDGESVANLMIKRGGKLSVDEAGPIILQVLDGLSYMHDKQIVHRDLKPSNILLNRAEGGWLPKITGLDRARLSGRPGFDDVFEKGSVVGTPAFMPREQVMCFKSLTPASDVWSIGATFYNMLTGQLPRDFQARRDTIAVVLNGVVIPITERDANIPHRVAEVIDRALAVSVEDRYQDAGEMLKAMKRVL